jgi:hypothetical protein
MGAPGAPAVAARWVVTAGWVRPVATVWSQAIWMAAPAVTGAAVVTVGPVVTVALGAWRRLRNLLTAPRGPVGPVVRVGPAG